MNQMVATHFSANYVVLQTHSKSKDHGSNPHHIIFYRIELCICEFYSTWMSVSLVRAIDMKSKGLWFKSLQWVQIQPRHLVEN